MSDGVSPSIELENYYQIECIGPDGSVKWTDEIKNLVVTAGLNDLLDKYFKGSTYSAAWYVGLTGATPSVVAGDTLASHGGWTEISAYAGTRKTLTLGTVSNASVDNSASKASFAINGTATVGGSFICTVTSGTAGVLYGAGAFSGGNKSVADGDTLNVTVTLTASAS